MNLDRALVWFRRDLRVDDHTALVHALRAARSVWCVFVLDRTILASLPRADRRVEFIVASLHELDESLVQQGGGILVLDGDPVVEIPRLAGVLGVGAVYANHDDDPYALRRDSSVRAALAERKIDFRTRKDHVIFEREEVLTAAGTPFSVFTPYKNAWLAKVSSSDLAPHAVQRGGGRLEPRPHGAAGVPRLEALGFAPTNLGEHVAAGSRAARERLESFLTRMDAYDETRDYPALDGPSGLSVHLRFGTISIRECARAAYDRRERSVGAATWLSELIWRDFFHQVLHHHPHVVGRAFRREYDAIEWESGAAADEAFAAWCDGRTGFPLVDAAMRQLAETGYMHNRLRMVAASFLTKDLGIDWRRGEQHFALQLNDFDLAANNGGWQWAASTGCDAQPYFRIFNPLNQSKRFDVDGEFIHRFVPELRLLAAPAVHAPWLAPPMELAAAGVELGRDYPLPIVEHDAARRRTLARYEVVKRARR